MLLRYASLTSYVVEAILHSDSVIIKEKPCITVVAVIHRFSRVVIHGFSLVVRHNPADSLPSPLRFVPISS